MATLPVSIVLPTFNRLTLLRSTLESVFAQTMTEWELIIADDGSNDETRAYLGTIGDPSRIKLLLLPHSGFPAVPRNAGVRAARGEYVAFLDSDDVWVARKLEVQLALLRSRRDCRWSYTAFTCVDAHGVALPGERDRVWDPHEGDIFERLVLGEAAIRTPSVVAERGLIIEAGLFDETMRSAEDYDLWTRLALRSEVALADEALVQIRSHGDQLSDDWSSAFAGRDHFLTKLQELAEPGRRPLLRRERARNAALLAMQHAARGNARAAWRSLLASAPYSWPHPAWWRGASRSVMRPLVPAWLLDLRRRRRDGGIRP